MFNPSTYDAVCKAIDSEREFQLRMWGADGTHRTVGDYILFAQDYVEEAVCLAQIERVFESLHTLRKVVALVVACLEIRQYNGDRAAVYNAIRNDFTGGSPDNADDLANVLQGLDAMLCRARRKQTRTWGDAAGLKTLHVVGAAGVLMMQRFGALERDLTQPIKRMFPDNSVNEPLDTAGASGNIPPVE